MTSLNHAITGSAIAVAVNQPALALPLAFLSHFAIDALPHWNYQVYGKLHHRIMYLDGAATILIPIAAAEYLNKSVWLILFAAFLAVSPDVIWLPNILRGKRSPRDKQNLLHLLRRLHKRIQTSETNAGIYYEGIWFSLMLVIIFVFKK